MRCVRLAGRILTVTGTRLSAYQVLSEPGSVPRLLRAAGCALLLVLAAACPCRDAAGEEEKPSDQALAAYEGLLPFGLRGIRQASSARDTKRFRQVRETTDRALLWLACHQDPTGVFDVGDLSWADGKRIPELSGTVKRAEFVAPVHALVLCAFLGAGYGPRGDHPFAKAVQKGLGALARLLWVGGKAGTERYVRRRASTYTLALAFGLRAFTEAFAATGDERYRNLATSALKSCLEARTTYFAWGYAFQDARNETFLTASVAFGLDAVWTTNRASLFAGLKPPLDPRAAGKARTLRGSMDGVGHWFARVTDRQTGAVGYRRTGTKWKTSVAAGRVVPTSPVACKAMADWYVQRQPSKYGKEPPRRAWRKSILASLPAWGTGTPGHDLVEWWFVAMACAADRSGRASKWRQTLDSVLIDNQVTGGDRGGVRGSWDPTGKWGFASGRVGTTALAVLCLAAPRLTPVLGNPLKEPDGKRRDMNAKMLLLPLREEVRADLVLALVRYGCDGAAAAAKKHLEHDSPVVRRAARLALQVIER